MQQSVRGIHKIAPVSETSMYCDLGTPPNKSLLVLDLSRLVRVTLCDFAAIECPQGPPGVLLLEALSSRQEEQGLLGHLCAAVPTAWPLREPDGSQSQTPDPRVSKMPLLRLLWSMPGTRQQKPSAEVQTRTRAIGVNNEMIIQAPFPSPCFGKHLLHRSR